MGSQSKRQRIVTTSRSLVIVLDDTGTRQSETLVQRVMSLSKVMPVDAKVDAAGVGTVGFGRKDQRRWYYSPALFALPSVLEEAVATLVSNPKSERRLSSIRRKK